MPFGPYGSFNDCVAKNGDKTKPEAFCAWLEHKITGAWPGEMRADQYPVAFWDAYDMAMTAKKSEAEAFQEGTKAAEAAGYNLSRFGWVKELQAPAMKAVTGVRVFGAGTWTDSAGFERTWTEEDLDKMVEAFQAGVPAVVPVKCGHTSDEFNRRIAEALGVPVEVITGDKGQGQISVGRISALERKGSWNIASFDRVPEPIADLIEGGQYSTVSVEIEDQVGDYGPVITGVALLGAEEPAVEGATLERALVFGGQRKGARVWSFKVGDDIPMSELKAEFDDIRGKLAEIVKGKRGAPVFRALFGNLSELFDRLSNGRHTARLSEDFEPYPWDKCMADMTARYGNKETAAKVCAAIKNRTVRHSEVPEILEGIEAELGIKFKGGKHQMSEELKAIAAALGLGEEATIEDVMAALQAVIEKAATNAAKPPEEEMKSGDDQGDHKEAEGEMAKEFAKANDRIATLEATLASERSLREWEARTQSFTSIPGTPHEHAVKLAAIEGKAGKEVAEDQFKALESANNLTAEALKVKGTTRTGGPSDFDNEVKKYMDAHTDKTKPQAIEAVSKLHPDLYFARRDSWDQ
jgi:hypothetical protein